MLLFATIIRLCFFRHIYKYRIGLSGSFMIQVLFIEIVGLGEKSKRLKLNTQFLSWTCQSNISICFVCAENFGRPRYGIDVKGPDDHAQNLWESFTSGIRPYCTENNLAVYLIHFVRVLWSLPLFFPYLSKAERTVLSRRESRLYKMIYCRKKKMLLLWKATYYEQSSTCSFGSRKRQMRAGILLWNLWNYFTEFYPWKIRWWQWSYSHSVFCIRH